MDFNNLMNGHQCDCLESAKEDAENSYAIKTNKNVLRTQDFTSYWEKGKRPCDEDCKEICSLKGISISIFNDQTKNEVVKIFQELFPLAPKYKPYLSVIRFYKSSGMIKHTPDNINIHHHDFYKCDDFDFSKVNLINTHELH
jgi:hypothetical protein